MYSILLYLFIWPYNRYFRKLINKGDYDEATINR